MNDLTNIHPGSLDFPIQGSQSIGVVPLSLADERELMQLFYEMILNEKELEEAK
jgi:hypothetical protein